MKKLRDMNIDDVVEIATQSAIQTLYDVSFSLSPRVAAHIHDDQQSFTRLGETLRDLYWYARNGQTADWGDDAGALDAVQTVHRAMFARAIDATASRKDGEGQARSWWEDLADDSDVGLVLRIAYARACIRTLYSDIPANWVADLAGISPGRIRQLVKEGRLSATADMTAEGKRSLVSPESARKWLEDQGAVGFKRENSGE